jgi:DNA invertase Pin-like site-specific DNA recombinase
MLIGYMRVSTGEQNLDLQRDTPRAIRRECSEARGGLDLRRATTSTSTSKGLICLADRNVRLDVLEFRE